jgi:hypothetical protein
MERHKRKKFQGWCRALWPAPCTLERRERGERGSSRPGNWTTIAVPTAQVAGRKRLPSRVQKERAGPAGRCGPPRVGAAPGTETVRGAWHGGQYRLEARGIITQDEVPHLTPNLNNISDCWVMCPSQVAERDDVSKEHETRSAPELTEDSALPSVRVSGFANAEALILAPMSGVGCRVSQPSQPVLRSATRGGAQRLTDYRNMRIWAAMCSKTWLRNGAPFRSRLSFVM